MPVASEESGNSVVIVGSGIAGSALATVLAQDGRHVTVIERSMIAQPRIHGEGLFPGGADALKELGLEECLSEAGAVHLPGLCLIDKATDRKAPLPFPPESKGYNIKNHLFVQALRRRAQEEKRCTYIEASAEDVIEEDGAIKGVIYKRKANEENEELRADLTVICDGGYSRFRKLHIEGKPVKHGTYVGFWFDSDLKDPIPLVPMFIGPRNATYANPVNSKQARAMCYIRGDWPADLTEHVKKQIETVSDDLATLMLEKFDDVTFAKAHTFHSHSKAKFRPGVITIGDALNMRHPVTAAGMTVAFKDIILWRDLLREIPDLRAVETMHEVHTRFLSKRKAYSFVVNLHARLFGELAYPMNDEGEFDRDCMLEYLLWSKRARRDMAAITAVKETRPWVLLYHLAMSTLFNANTVVWQNGWTGLPMGLINGAKSLYYHTTGLMSFIMEEYHSSD